MINTLHILTHAALFNLNFPANVFRFLKVVNDVASFELIPASNIQERVWNFKGEEPQNKNFEVMGYETKNSILNMGSMYVLLLFSLLMALVVAIFRAVF